MNSSNNNGMIDPTKMSEESLRKWHTEFLEVIVRKQFCPNMDPIEQLENDEIKYDEIERQAQSLAVNISIIDGFCPECTHLLAHWPDLDRKIGSLAVAREFTIINLQAAVRAGCQFCGLLFTRLTLSKQLDIFRRIEQRFKALNDTRAATLIIATWSTRTEFVWINYPASRIQHYNAFGGPVTTQFNATYLSPTTSVALYPMSQLDLAKMWLDRCFDAHEECLSPAQSPHQLPGRLISVADGQLKLVQTATLEDTTPKYTTLSYCWGQDTFMTLTNSNIESLLSSVSFEALPKTFQDAIVVTRHLGLKYVWIDALCIIQDQGDNRDWIRESQIMKSIYGGSSAAIIAASATCVEEGFLDDSQKLRTTFAARTSTKTISSAKSFHSMDPYKEAYIDNFLNTRAWALQERLLSPRCLYFGNKGLYWECNCSMKSEWSPARLRETFPRSPGREWLDWGEIVANYSSANLTVGSDRLPALSGIASKWHSTHGHQYAAGLWNDDTISKQLSWIVGGSHGERPRPDWRAPTWSWASVDGKASWNRSVESTTVCIRVVDIWTTLSTTDPFGSVSGGELTLACTDIVSARITIPDLELDAPLNEGTGDDDNKQKYNPDIKYILIDSCKHIFSIFRDCSDEGVEEDDVYLVPIFSGGNGIKSYDDEAYEKAQKAYKAANSGPGQDVSDYIEWTEGKEVRGLVLRPSKGKRGYFKRIGIFLFSDSLDEEYQKFTLLAENQDPVVIQGVCAKGEVGDGMRFIVKIE